MKKLNLVSIMGKPKLKLIIISIISLAVLGVITIGGSNSPSEEAEIIKAPPQKQKLVERDKTPIKPTVKKLQIPTSTPKPTSALTLKPTPTLTLTSIPRLTSTPTPRPTPTPKEETPITQPTVSQEPVSGGFSCDCSKNCSEMLSCEEAYYQLNNCGCSKRDGDNDGIPCESLCL